MSEPDYEKVLNKLFDANKTVTAVTIMDGSGNVLYQTSNWDITADIISTLNAWRKQEHSIVIQGIKYSILQCTKERLVATNVMGQGHIVAANSKDQYITLAYVSPDGGAGVAFMDVARANDEIMTGAPLIAAPAKPVIEEIPEEAPEPVEVEMPSPTIKPKPLAVPSSTWFTSSTETDMKSILWEIQEFYKFVDKGEFSSFLQDLLTEGDQVKAWELLKLIRSMKSFIERSRVL
ncbi:MAG: hypothetical protein EAX96_05245 [Candidatus Lokiarchaeota archaeon]|nr:hypothetical protein [Candidatus Lokiarchaeota archaeon]